MAKDGTNRGGRRVRAGDKPQPLAEKIAAGKAARILEAPEFKPESMLEASELDDTADLNGEICRRRVNTSAHGKKMVNHWVLMPYLLKHGNGSRNVVVKNS